MPKMELVPKMEHDYCMKLSDAKDIQLNMAPMQQCHQECTFYNLVLSAMVAVVACGLHTDVFIKQ